MSYLDENTAVARVLGTDDIRVEVTVRMTIAEWKQTIAAAEKGQTFWGLRRLHTAVRDAIRKVEENVIGVPEAEPTATTTGTKPEPPALEATPAVSAPAT